MNVRVEFKFCLNSNRLVWIRNRKEIGKTPTLKTIPKQPNPARNPAQIQYQTGPALLPLTLFLGPAPQPNTARPALGPSAWPQASSGARVLFPAGPRPARALSPAPVPARAFPHAQAHRQQLTARLQPDRPWPSTLAPSPRGPASLATATPSPTARLTPPASTRTPASARAASSLPLSLRPGPARQLLRLPPRNRPPAISGEVHAGLPNPGAHA